MDGKNNGGLNDYDFSAF